MHAPTYRLALHVAARARAAELRQQALDHFFNALGAAWRRLLCGRAQAEA